MRERESERRGGGGGRGVFFSFFLFLEGRGREDAQSGRVGADGTLLLLLFFPRTLLLFFSVLFPSLRSLFSLSFLLWAPSPRSLSRAEPAAAGRGGEKRNQTQAKKRNEQQGKESLFSSLPVLSPLKHPRSFHQAIKRTDVPRPRSA